MNKGATKIFIIKSPKNSLQKAEDFLKGRGFDVVGCSSIRDSINQILQFRPHFVMLPADHPNKSVRMLPTILQQSTSTMCVAYVENDTTTSILLLQQFKAAASIFPPLSGPGVERIIVGLLNQAKQKEAELAKAFAASSPEAPTLTYSNSQDKMDVSASGFDAAKSALVRLASVLENENDREAYRKTGVVEPEKPEAEKSADKPTIANLSKDLKGLNFNHRPATREQLDEVGKFALTAFERAVEDSKRLAMGLKNVTDLRSVSTCLSISSPLMRGYVLVVSPDPQLELFVAQKMREYLMDGLKAIGKGDSGCELFEISLESIPFKDLGPQAADMYVDGICNRNIVALAFFKSENAWVQHELSESKEMRKISFQEVVTEKPLPYEIFLYLPANKRFLLYSPTNSIITNEQKDRLVGKGVDGLFVKDGEMSKLYKTRAETDLEVRFTVPPKSTKK